MTPTIEGTRDQARPDAPQAVLDLRRRGAPREAWPERFTSLLGGYGRHRADRAALFDGLIQRAETERI